MKLLISIVIAITVGQYTGDVYQYCDYYCDDLEVYAQLDGSFWQGYYFGEIVVVKEGK